MSAVREWLAPFTWEMVTAQNAVLCAQKNAIHKPTSDGFEVTRSIWNTQHAEAMSLDAAVDLCRRCHRMAPFCCYNGNTFASIIMLVIRKLELAPAQAHLVRSLAGHIVAGVASDTEVEAFREFCESIE